MKNFLKNLIKLPTPVELGMSKKNALGMKSLTPFQKGPSWEDWHKKVKELHPIKYWINESFLKFIQKQKKLFKGFFYYLNCHLFSRHHMLDLRNADPTHSYKYGFLLPANIIKFAMWQGLRIYIEGYSYQNPRQLNYSTEDQLEPWFAEMCHIYDESKTLYHYLTVTKVLEKEYEDELYENSREAVKNNNEPEYRKIMDASVNHFLECEKREKEMLVRLAKIAPFLV